MDWEQFLETIPVLLNCSNF